MCACVHICVCTCVSVVLCTCFVFACSSVRACVCLCRCLYIRLSALVAFAELQTNLGDMGITEETSFQDLPFWSFDDYATKLLFPQGGGNRNSLMPLTSKLTVRYSLLSTK